MLQKQSSKVQFHFITPVSILKQRKELKAFIERLLKKHHKKTCSVQYIFCTDEYLLDINKRFLNHNYYTDIITFDLSEGEDLVAEIYISIDRVKDNSRQFKTTLTNELHRVIFHGILHLCGFKDKSPVEQKAMRTAEQKALNNYFK